ncbi:nucleoside/nucleotide kinase family protein [Natronosporangium hydrolyticum]|uniref:Nucleoside/nucleotide kinase family protein n=1 Tax=Natronosporangium hydrolyticum TaxID=2811111 RepID=A0A895YJX6_9ACTN|nr:nucleoside/nucleotide kinase family protein [Natronosporangium hydrolyticum]QSB15643.1 nucleoside/nucleotide kinase family protein [Natronosporangium hydrolyticum]
MPERLELPEDHLEPLWARARRLAGQGGRRLLGLAGAPGAGKSTVAELLVAELAPAAVLVPMDGFHLADAELHRLGRHLRKGAPDTFDAAGFVQLLSRLRDPAPEPVYAPRFDRSREDPVAGAIPVPPELPLVVTEGNYLLLAEGVWQAVRELLDEVWFIERDEATRVGRLTARHQAYGRSLAEAADRARGSDQRNAELIAGTRHRADLIVHLTPRRPAPPR